MKYVLAVLGVLAVGVIAILLIVNRSPSNSSNLKGAVKITDYDHLNATVSLTTQGRLVGENERQAIRITIARNERKIEILRGYEEVVERSNTYLNTQEAYEAFLRGIQLAGFTKSKTSQFSDYRGVCPLGYRYIYDLTYNEKHVSNLWSTSCSTSDGTFAGNAPLMRQIFQQQIPDYNKQVSGVKL